VHEEQTEKPVDSWKYPTPQLEHEVAEEAEYFPTAHAPETADKAADAQ